MAFVVMLKLKILILCSLLLRWILMDKVPQRFFVALWLLVIYLLLSPIELAGPASFYHWLDFQEFQLLDVIVLQFPLLRVLKFFHQELLRYCAFIGILFLVICCWLWQRHVKKMTLKVVEQGIIKSSSTSLIVPVCFSEHIKAPLTYGLLKPRILLPARKSLNKRTNKCILLHEYSHILGKDNWLKIVGILTLSFYWCNPLVWLLYIFLCRDIEIACDERVIQNYDIGAKEYAEVLFEQAEMNRENSRFDTYFASNALEERVLHIAKRPVWQSKRQQWISVLLFIIIFFIGTMFPQDTFTLQFNPKIMQYWRLIAH